MACRSCLKTPRQIFEIVFTIKNAGATVKCDDVSAKYDGANVKYMDASVKYDDVRYNTKEHTLDINQ